MKPKAYFEYEDSPNCHFCVIDKSKKEVTVGEGTIMPFVTRRVKFEDFLIESIPQFSKEKQIDIEKYVNS